MQLARTSSLLLLIAMMTGLARAEGPAAPVRPGLDPEASIARSQAVVGSVVGEFSFTDSTGRVRTWSEFRGQPLLVNFIYTGCFEVCPTSSRALRRAVLGMRGQFGTRQFQVLSIGFNQPADSPAALRDFAARQGIDDPNWVFLAPDRSQVQALHDAFGFSQAPTPLGFDHTLQVSIIDAEGRIREQVYGDAFSADALGEPLRRLLGGTYIAKGRTLADLIDRVRILCSVYDPATGRYRTNWAMWLEIAGGLTFILWMSGFAAQEWWRQRQARRTAARP